MHEEADFAVGIRHAGEEDGGFDVGAAVLARDPHFDHMPGNHVDFDMDVLVLVAYYSPHKPDTPLFAAFELHTDHFSDSDPVAARGGKQRAVTFFADVFDDPALGRAG